MFADALSFSVGLLLSLGDCACDEPDVLFSDFWPRFELCACAICATKPAVSRASNTPRIRIFSYYMPPNDDPAKYRDEVMLRMVEIARPGDLAILVYTSSRAGAVAKLRLGNFYNAGQQWMLHFAEKGGKSREIPVRGDLQEMISAYIGAANLRDAPKETPLFQSALKRQRRLTGKAIHDLRLTVGRDVTATWKATATRLVTL